MFLKSGVTPPGLPLFLNNFAVNAKIVVGPFWRSDRQFYCGLTAMLAELLILSPTASIFGGEYKYSSHRLLEALLAI